VEQRIDFQVHVEVWPAQVIRGRPFDPSELPDRGVFEPGKIPEGREQLSAVDAEPDATRCDVYDLNTAGAQLS
jgi:hypothetical protein